MGRSRRKQLIGNLPRWLGWKLSEAIASVLFWIGFRYGVSTSIIDTTTYGYGYLSGNGFWQFEIPPKLVEERYRKKELVRSRKLR